MPRSNSWLNRKFVFGTSGDDFIDRSSQTKQQKIYSFGGDDTVLGGSASDFIKALSGKNLIDSGSGHDRIWTGWGNDTIKAGDGNDWVWSDRGHDNVDAGDGNDRVFGGGGKDTILGGEGNDSIFAGPGFDTAVYRGSILDFEWIQSGWGRIDIIDKNASDGDEGTDRLFSINALEFDDFVFNLQGPNAALVIGTDGATDEDTPTTVAFDAYDFDGGTVSLVSIASSAGSVALASTSALAQGMGIGMRYEFTFDPGADFQHLAVNESSSATVTIVVDDGQGNQTTETLEVAVSGVNDDPVFGPVVYVNDMVQEDGVLVASGSVSATDIDGDTLGYAIQGSNTGTYGSISINQLTGSWTYNLNNALPAVQALSVGQTDTDTFTVEVTDGNGGSDTIELNLNVEGANDTPVLNGVNYDSSTVSEDNVLAATGSIDVTDVDALDSLSYFVLGSNESNFGTLTVNPDGTWTYDLKNDSEFVQNLNTGETRTDSFAVNVLDKSNKNVVASISIDITGEDDAGAGDSGDVNDGGTPGGTGGTGGEDEPVATTLTFEEFEDSASIAGNYGGVTWSANWIAYDSTTFFQGGDGRGGGQLDTGVKNANVTDPGKMVGYANGTVRIDGLAQDSEVGDSFEAFDLDSAYLTAAFTDGLTVTARAFNHEQVFDSRTGLIEDVYTLIGFESFTLNHDAPTYVKFDDAIFDNVERVEFTTSGGTPLPIPPSGSQFAIDDLTIFV